MEIQELVEAVKEAVDEKLAPFEERLATLESQESSKSSEEEAEELSGSESGEGTGGEEESTKAEEGGLTDEVKEAIGEAVKEHLEPISEELNEFKTGLDKMVGARKSITDDGETSGDGETAVKSGAQRDAWGRRRHQKVGS